VLSPVVIVWHTGHMQELMVDAKKRLRVIAASERFSWLSAVRDALPGSSWFIVGGTVRDALLDRGDDADIDVVVRGAAYADLKEVLARHGRVDLVGRVFGVLKFRPEGSEEVIDVALPRTERAGMSGGYRDFAVQSDPSLPIEADLARRDFTVNAMAYDIAADAIIDPHGGVDDARSKVVRAVGVPAERFTEDVSRALRGIRFACALGFTIEPATEHAAFAAVRRLEAVHPETGERIVPKETVAKEFMKALAAAPHRAVEMLDASGALAVLIPEIQALKGCVQSPDHHAEGDVWRHTMLALKSLGSVGFTQMFPGESADAETALAVLLHDVAKPRTTAFHDGHITFYGHAEQGAVMARAIAERLLLSSADGMVDADRLEWLIHMHLFPITADLAAVRKTTLVRHFLADRARGRRLLHLAFADAAASLQDRKVGPNVDHVSALMAALTGIDAMLGGDSKKTLLTGEEVMAEANLSPGPEIGTLLEALREAHLRGEVADHEQAKEFIKKIAQQS